MSDSMILVEIDVVNWIERKQLQQELHKEISDIVLHAKQPAQPTPEKLQKLKDLLYRNPRWDRLLVLVERMKFVDAVSTIPYEKSFLYYTRLQDVVGHLLEDTAISFPYLKLIIQRFDADNEHIEKDLNAPIHYAVRQLNGEFLDWLLNDRKSTVDVNSRNNQKKTALAILCVLFDKCMKKTNHQNHSSVNMLEKIKHLFKKLLTAGADFNICSQQFKLPFELLLKHRQTDEATARFVDQCVQRAGQALAIGRINDSKMRVVEIYNQESPVKVTEELLEICLRYKDQPSFEKLFSSFKITEKNVKKVIEVILHTAVEQKLLECVRKIVSLGGSLIFKAIVRSTRRNRMTKEKCSVHRSELKGLLKKACLTTDVSIVQLLVNRMTDSLLLNEDSILALTLTKAYAAKRRPEEQAAHLAVAEYLATQRNIYKFKPDNSGNTPLHLALKYGFHEIATTILKQRNAYIGVRNRSKQTPLHYGGYEFWKNYFDSCIEVTNQRSGAVGQLLKFNLSCLKPYKAGPTIRCDQEMTVIRQIAESNDLKSLLIHPIIYTFIMVKWIRLSSWMYLNLLLTCATMLIFGWHSLDACSRDTNAWLKFGASIGTLFIVVRELLQLSLLRMSYARLENVVDFTNIIVMIVVLSNGCNGLLSSLLMVSFALQLTVLLSSLPFNSLSTIMYMFKTVSQNFLKSFLLFLPLIGSFIFAFYLTYNDTWIEADVLGPSNYSSNNNNNTSSATNSFNNFSTFWDATIKTLVMTTGEFDAADIDFSAGKLLLFLVFLFFAPIVILNLINGLAVSDIAAIRAESEWISIYKKVMLMERYERGVANLPLSCNLLMMCFKRFLSNLPWPCSLPVRRYKRFLVNLSYQENHPAWVIRLFPQPFFSSYKCWIQVVLDQSRKILVQVIETTSQEPAGQSESLSSQSVSSTVQLVAEQIADLIQAKREPKKKNPTLISLSTCSMLWGKGTEKPINLLFVTVPTFLTLDRAIANEALAVAERKLLSGKPLAVEKKPTASSSEHPSLPSGTVANSKNTKTENELAALQDEVRRLGDIVNQLHLSLQKRKT